MRKLLAAFLTGVSALVWGASAQADPVSPAEPTDAEEQFEMGRRYLSGSEQTEKNPAEAAKWFRKAAEQGHSRAQVQLGMAYQQGRGVEKDIDESLAWLRKAAEQRHPKAMLELGLAYRDGRGVAKDQVQSLMWLILSSQHGSFVARLVSGGVARRLAPPQRERARELVMEWREAHGLPPAPGRPAKSESAESGSEAQAEARAESEPASGSESAEPAPEAPRPQETPEPPAP